MSIPPILLFASALAALIATMRGKTIFRSRLFTIPSGSITVLTGLLCANSYARFVEISQVLVLGLGIIVFCGSIVIISFCAGRKI